MKPPILKPTTKCEPYFFSDRWDARARANLGKTATCLLATNQLGAVPVHMCVILMA